MTRAIHSTATVLLFCAAIVSGAFNSAAVASEDSTETPVNPSGSPLAGTEADRIVAFGDVHGGADELRELLEALTLIDESGDWRGDRTRLVSLGDLLDRGPDSRAVMDLLMKLEAQAAAAGGAVHLVLGNHELMNLTGDLRYVSDEEYAAFQDDEDPNERARALQRFQAQLQAAKPPKPQTHTRIAPKKEPEVDATALFAERFPPGYFAHRAAFAADGAYGSWLLSKPQVLELDGVAFVHGGLSDTFSNRSIPNHNEQADEELRALLAAGDRLVAAGRLSPWQDSVTATPADSQALPPTFTSLRTSLQFDPTGPAWYRGTAGCHALIERPRFEAVLEARGLKRIVMGHTPTNPRIIQTRFEDRAVLADTGMYGSYYRGRPSAVIFSADEMRTLTLKSDGTLVEVRGRPAIDARAESEKRWLEQIAESLAGLTLRPDRVIEFEANNRRLEAIWHKDSRKEQSARLAAYALDKLLGFGLVAPALLIEQDGRTGVVEVLPATLLSETTRATGNVYRPNYCKSSLGGPGADANDFDLLLILDALMGQEKRDGDNLAYDRATWLMYVTEQQRTFSRQERLPNYVARQSVVLPRLVVEKLEALNQAVLTEALGGYLDERQIAAILVRRDLLLAHGTRAE